MPCITPAYVRGIDFAGVLIDPPVTDAVLENCISEVERLRWQLIQDFGCNPVDWNVVPDLLAYEVAHKVWLMFMMVGANPNIFVPPQMGPIKSASFSRAGTSGSKTRAIGNFNPADFIDEAYWAQTPFGMRWWQLWIALPPELTSSSGSTSARGACGGCSGVSTLF